MDGMPQALPIDRLGEVRRKARSFGRGDVTLDPKPLRAIPRN